MRSSSDTGWRAASSVCACDMAFDPASVRNPAMVCCRLAFLRNRCRLVSGLREVLLARVVEFFRRDHRARLAPQYRIDEIALRLLDLLLFMVCVKFSAVPARRRQTAPPLPYA